MQHFRFLTFRYLILALSVEMVAQTALEDVYLAILKTDGPEYVDKLRARMHKTTEEPLPTEQSWLLSYAN